LLFGGFSLSLFLIRSFARSEPSCKEVSDIIELEDERRASLLSMLSKEQMQDVARAVNRYPAIEMEFEVENAAQVAEGGAVRVGLKLQRDMEEGDRLGPVYAPFYPGEKIEGWWAVVGDVEKNHLYSIKRVTVAKAEVAEEIEFEAPLAGMKRVLFSILKC
jgi:pre-mRNA-splicing helicase BRR2